MMKSDVVVVDYRWTHEFMLWLLLESVVDTNSCFGYWYICCCLMSFLENGSQMKMLSLVNWS